MKNTEGEQILAEMILIIQSGITADIFKILKEITGIINHDLELNNRFLDKLSKS